RCVVAVACHDVDFHYPAAAAVPARVRIRDQRVEDDASRAYGRVGDHALAARGQSDVPPFLARGVVGRRDRVVAGDRRVQGRGADRVGGQAIDVTVQARRCAAHDGLPDETSQTVDGGTVIAD